MNQHNFSNITEEENGTLIVNKDSKEKSLIWLHGLGDTPHGFSEIFSYMAPKSLRIVLLQAPMQPVTINNGAKMPCWYDIKTLSRNINNNNEDKNGIIESSKIINKYIDKEIKYMNDSKKVSIGGFSQGAAMAYHCGYHYPKPLNCIIGLSGYVLLTSNYPKEIHLENKSTPLLCFHGKLDDMVPYDYGKNSIMNLKNHINLNFQSINNIGHSVNDEEIDLVCKFVLNPDIISKL